MSKSTRAPRISRDWIHVSYVNQDLPVCPNCGGVVSLAGTEYVYHYCRTCGTYRLFTIEPAGCRQREDPAFYTPLEIEGMFPIPRKESHQAKPRDMMFGMVWETDGRISIYRRKK